jgi:hypothetical protein
LFHKAFVVDADSMGNIYVLDAGNYRIQKFDSTGRFLRTIGKKGQGPGELNWPTHMVVDNQDRIIVYDTRNNRISLFSSEGELLNDFSMGNIVTRYMKVHHFLVSQSGDIIFSQEQIDYQKEKMYLTFKRIHPEAHLMTDIFQIEVAIFAKDFGDSRVHAPIQNVHVEIGCDDCFWLAYRDRYNIEKYTNKGTLTKSITKSFTPVLMSDEEKEEATKTDLMYAGKRLRLPAPDYHDDVQGLFLYDNKELWVLTSQKNQDNDYLIDVYDCEGNSTGKMTTNSQGRALFKDFVHVFNTANIWKNGKLYEIYTADDDFPQVRIYGIRMTDG